MNSHISNATGSLSGNFNADGNVLTHPRFSLAPASDNNGEPPYMSDVKERLARLEAVTEGLSRTQEFTLVSVIGVGAILSAFIIGFSIYGFQRFDQISEKVNDLPSKISSDLRDITKTLAESITAAKQVPPQIIIMPAPLPLPPYSPPPSNPK